MRSTLALLVLVGFSVSAFAAEDEKKKKKKNTGPDVGLIYTKLDANSDKKVSKDEFAAFKGLVEKEAKKEPKGLAAARDEWFKKLDTNNDASLTVEEFAKVKDVVAANPIAKKKKEKQ